MDLIDRFKQFEGLTLTKVKDFDKNIALFFKLDKKDPRYKKIFMTPNPVIFISKKAIEEPLQLDL